MAGDEGRASDEVGRADRLRAETQMRDGDGAGLLRVVDEVALRPQIRFVADDLDEFLLAPTVPSAPSPKNTARTAPAGSTSKSSSTGNESPVMSSTMPTVKWARGGRRELIEYGLRPSPA